MSVNSCTLFIKSVLRYESPSGASYGLRLFVLAVYGRIFIDLSPVVYGYWTLDFKIEDERRKNYVALRLALWIHHVVYLYADWYLGDVRDLSLFME
jgi:hypothetical protein